MPLSILYLKVFCKLLLIFSSSVEPFLEKVDTLQKYLSTVNEVLNKWWYVQQKWIYLSEIYARKDILNILSEKSKKFNELNKFYQEVSCY